jgi:hypothetical protein
VWVDVSQPVNNFKPQNLNLNQNATSYMI